MTASPPSRRRSPCITSAADRGDRELEIKGVDRNDAPDETLASSDRSYCERDGNQRAFAGFCARSEACPYRHRGNRRPAAGGAGATDRMAGRRSALVTFQNFRDRRRLLPTAPRRPRRRSGIRPTRHRTIRGFDSRRKVQLLRLHANHSPQIDFEVEQLAVRVPEDRAPIATVRMGRAASATDFRSVKPEVSTTSSRPSRSICIIGGGISRREDCRRGGAGARRANVTPVAGMRDVICPSHAWPRDVVAGHELARCPSGRGQQPVTTIRVGYPCHPRKSCRRRALF